MILALNQPPPGEPGTAVTIKLEKPSNAKKAEEEGFRDAWFDQIGSYLIWGARQMLENMLNEHRDELSKYNRRLGRAHIPIRVRPYHTTTVKGNKYIYCGRYLYTKDGEYKGKLDNAVLRNELKEQWNQIGPPPRNPLDGLSYRIFVANGEETNCVIVSYEQFHNANYHHLFAKLTRIRLGGI